MDPTIFDLSINDASVVTSANPTLIPTSVVMPPMDRQKFIDRLTTPQLGRAYGLEVLLRRQSKTGVFGWISYTLSRSERYRDDRVGAVRLRSHAPRSTWSPGCRCAATGTSACACSTRAAARRRRPPATTPRYGDGYFRFDFRVDKRAVWQKWLLDFYVDITNVALLPEEVQPGTVIRYVLPTVGLRGRF